MHSLLECVGTIVADLLGGLGPTGYTRTAEERRDQNGPRVSGYTAGQDWSVPPAVHTIEPR